MAEFFRFAWQDLVFWSSLAADVLILVSVIFSLLYALFMLAASLPPFRGKFRPNAWVLPLILALSAALPLSPAAEVIAATLSQAIRPLYVKFGEKPQYVIAGLWVLGCLAQLAALTRRCRAVGRCFKSLREAPPDPVFDEARLRLGLESVRLKELGEGQWRSPFSWGLFHRFIAVPAGFVETFGPEERRAVYLHELTHIKSRDSLKYIFIGCVKALFWFNPIVGSAASRYKNHLEIVCDRSVIERQGLNFMDYSRLMLRAASGGAGPAPAFSAAYRDMARRLGYIFGDAEIIPVKKDRLLAAACLLPAALGLVGLNPGLAGFQAEPGMEESREVVTPDGKKGVVTVKFQWRGALGGYAISEMKKTE